jgi:hypothetical protein
LALNGPAGHRDGCPLIEHERTYRGHAPAAAFDPKQALGRFTALRISARFGRRLERDAWLDTSLAVAPVEIESLHSGDAARISLAPFGTLRSLKRCHKGRMND